MELVLPSFEHKNSFIEAVKEFVPDQLMKSRDLDAFYERFSIPELESNFDILLDYARDRREGVNLSEGRVPSTDYWLVDNGEFIGRVNIRHMLNEHLKKMGGHIGYDIRPSKRRQGYGSKILELALPKARELGIDRVLLTCDATNDASRKIIEKNGGVLENQVPNSETGVDKLRFWIAL